MSQKFLIYLVALGIVIVAASAGYLIIAKNSPPVAAPQLSSGLQATTTTAAPATQERMVSWKEFKNTKYGYSFSYPDVMEGGPEPLVQGARDAGILDIAVFRAVRGVAFPISLVIAVEAATTSPPSLEEAAQGYEAGSKQSGVSLHDISSRYITVDGVRFLEKRYVGDSERAKNVVVRFALVGSQPYTFTLVRNYDAPVFTEIQGRIIESFRIAKNNI